MQIRRAEISDIDTLVTLRTRQLIDEGDAPTDIAGPLARYFQRAMADGSFLCFVAIEEARIVATAALCLYTLPPSFSNVSGLTAYATNVYTDPAYRRRGFATRLMTLVIGEARARGCVVLRLHASRDGAPVYEKLGFTRSEGYMALRL